MTARQRLGVVILIAGLIAVVVGGLRWASTPAGDFGMVPAVADVTSAVDLTTAGSSEKPTSVADTSVDPVRTTAPSAGTSFTPPPSVTGDPAPAASLGERPVEVRLDRWDVSAPVDEVFAVDGVLQVPADPQRLGWWSAGGWIGADAGTAVIDGHLDSATRGVGFLVHLQDVIEGDTVTVVTESGRSLSFAVTGRQTLPKSAGLPTSLFARDGPPSLVLITCGGPFDAAKGSYEDNVAVTARPL